MKLTRFEANATAVFAVLMLMLASLSVAPSSSSDASPAVLPEAAGAMAGATLDGAIYLFGGVNATHHFLPTILRHDPQTGAVAEVGQLPSARADASAVATPFGIFVFGGRGCEPRLDCDEVIRFDPAAGSVDVVATLPWGLHGLSAAWADDRVVLVGGMNVTQGGSAAILEFDPANGTFQDAANFPYPLTETSVAFLDGLVYILGGCCEYRVPSSTVWTYDPHDRTLAKLPDRLPHGISGAAAVAHSRDIYVVGGALAYYGGDVVRFTPGLSSFEKTADLARPLLNPYAGVVGSDVVVVGGHTAKSGATTAEIQSFPLMPTHRQPDTLMALPVGDGIALTWTQPSGQGEALTGYVISRAEGTDAPAPLVTVSASNRTFFDKTVRDNVTYAYQVAAVTAAAQGEPLAASPVTAVLADSPTARFSVASGTLGSAGWYRSPLTLDVAADGTGDTETYEGVESIGVSRDGVGHARVFYVHEMETLEGVSASSPDPLTVPTLSLDPTNSVQGQSSVRATFTTNPSNPGAGAPKVALTGLSGFNGSDTLALWAYFSSSSTTPKDASIDVRILAGDTLLTTFADVSLPTPAWQQIKLDITGLPLQEATGIEIVLETADSPLSETMSFWFDGVQAVPGQAMQETKEGIRVWKAVVRDADGKDHETPFTEYRVDWTPPVTTTVVRSYEGGDGWKRSEAVLTLSAIDATSGVQAITYRIGSGAYQTYDAPIKLAAAGRTCVHYYGIDIAGNAEAIQTKCIWVDGAGPKVSISLEGTGNGEWFSTPVTARMLAEDAHSGSARLYYQVDSDIQRAATDSIGALKNPADVVISGTGTHVVKAFGLDKAGNVGLESIISFGIEFSPPRILWRAPQPDASGSSPTEVVAAFDDLAELPSSGINAARTTIRVEQHNSVTGHWVDITSQGTVAKTESDVQWTPDLPLTAGAYRVHGLVYDNAGSSIALEPTPGGWGFTVTT